MLLSPCKNFASLSCSTMTQSDCKLGGELDPLSPLPARWGLPPPMIKPVAAALPRATTWYWCASLESSTSRGKPLGVNRRQVDERHRQAFATTCGAKSAGCHARSRPRRQRRS